jgi:hypothetical protein
VGAGEDLVEAKGLALAGVLSGMGVISRVAEARGWGEPGAGVKGERVVVVWSFGWITGVVIEDKGSVLGSSGSMDKSRAVSSLL